MSNPEHPRKRTIKPPWCIDYTTFYAKINSILKFGSTTEIGRQSLRAGKSGKKCALQKAKRIFWNVITSVHGDCDLESACGVVVQHCRSYVVRFTCSHSVRDFEVATTSTVIVVCKFLSRRIVQIAIVVSAVVGSSYAIRTARCWNESELNSLTYCRNVDVIGLI